MKNLSNIKSTLAVSMLLSASLFSADLGCGCKLVGEILGEKISAPKVVIGEAGVQKQRPQIELLPPVKTNVLDEDAVNTAQGISVTKAKQILDLACSRHEAAATMLAGLQAHESLRKFREQQYSIVRNPVDKTPCLNTLIDAHIYQAALVTTDDKLKTANENLEHAMLSAFAAKHRFGNETYSLSAYESDLTKIQKRINKSNAQLIQSIEDYSENAALITASGFRVREGKTTKNKKCGGFSVELMLEAENATVNYDSLYKEIMKSDDQDALQYKAQVEHLKKLFCAKEALEGNIKLTKASKSIAESAVVEAEQNQAAAQEKFVRALHCTSDDRAYRLNSIRISDQEIRKNAQQIHKFCPTFVKNRNDVIREELNDYVATTSFRGTYESMQENFLASNKEMVKKIGSLEARFASFLKSNPQLREQYLDYDCARILGQKRDVAIQEVHTRILNLQHVVKEHEGYDRVVPAAPQSLFARLCFWK